MNSLKTQILKIKPLWAIFFLFLFLHLALININSAEWGDSYRILRASTIIRGELSYPQDEKRPPLYSALLALKPSSSMDWVIWGRVVMLGVSVIAFWVFYKVSESLIESKKALYTALLFFAVNNIYFYWSLRIYADVFFSLLSLITVLLWLKFKKTQDHKFVALAGIFCGLTILTRFEGYILSSALMGSMGLEILVLRKKAVKGFFYALSGLLTISLPYLIFRNPLSSAYLEETQRRGLTAENVMIFTVSLIFSTGLIQGLAFSKLSKKTISSVLYLASFPVLFTLGQLTMAFLWPAAIPRLLVPAIPFLIIALAPLINNFFENKTGQGKAKIATAASLLTFFFLAAQTKLRLQFLVPHKWMLIAFVAMQIPVLYGIVKRNYAIFTISFLSQAVFLLISTVFLHKDIYKSLQNVSLFSSRETRGKIAHNDVNALAEWYLNYDDSSKEHESNRGQYINADDKSTLTEEFLKKENVNYVMITNEHNPDLTIDLKKRPYLTKIYEKKYEHGGKIFFTWLAKVN